ncbi:MAG: hypothetical protein NTX86_00955, partial [Candidatus Dependentiae bacterium]|nr:hypothetical protein [Candidatus Dependentiae bacterium]
MCNKLFVGIAVCVAIFLGLTVFTKMKGNKQMFNIRSTADVIQLFPKSVKEIEQLTEHSIASAQQAVNEIIAVPVEEKNYTNTFKALDTLHALSNLAIAAAAVEILEMVSPDKELRDAAHAMIIKIQGFVVDHMSNNVELCNALKAYVEGNAKKELLSEGQWY